MRQRSWFSARLAIAWLVGLSLGHADAGGPVRLPAGVADPAGIVAYFQGKEGGIDAVELATGKRLWTNAEIGAPLLVVADRLLAFTFDRSALVVLNRANGDRLKQSNRLDFPKEIAANNGGHALDSWGFAAEAHEAGGKFYLLWKGRHPVGPPSGIPVSAKRLKEMIEVFRGAFCIDLETGKVQTVERENLPRALGPLLATNEQSVLTFHGEDVAIEKFVALGLDKLPVRAMYYGTHDSVNAVLAGDAIVAAVLLGETGKDDQLKLVHWNIVTGKREGVDVALATGPTDKLVHYRPRISLDNRYLFVADLLQAKPKRDFSMFDMRTGKRVAQWPQAPFEQAAVVGNKLLVLREGQPERPQVVNGPGVHYPRSIHALDVETGATLWERAAYPRYSPPMLMVP